MIKLLIKVVDEKDIDYDWNLKSLTIGRSSKANLQIKSTQISRKHALLEAEGEQLYLTDLGSSNGTYYNDQRILKGLRTEISRHGTIRISRDVTVELEPEAGFTSTATLNKDMLPDTSSHPEIDTSFPQAPAAVAPKPEPKPEPKPKPKPEPTPDSTPNQNQSEQTGTHVSISQLLSAKKFMGQDDSTMDRIQREEWAKEKRKLRKEKQKVALKTLFLILCVALLFFGYKFI